MSLNEPVEFFRAISSALDVLRWSIRKLGMLNGVTCMLSDENWCLNGRCRSGDGIDKLSNFSLLRCCRSMWSSISCKTCEHILSRRCACVYVCVCVCALNTGRQSKATEKKEKNEKKNIYIDTNNRRKKIMEANNEKGEEREVITIIEMKMVKYHKKLSTMYSI